MTTITADTILQVTSGFMAAKHLFVANEIGLFEQLADGPATLDALSQRTGIPRRTLRIVADAMVALGFVERQADSYRNGPVAATYLAGRTPADLRPFLRFWNRISYPAWMRLEEAVRTGQPAAPPLSEELGQIFSAGVEAVSAAAAEALAISYDFARHRRLLGLGGATGAFLLAVLRHYAGLQATLFELPPAAARAAHSRIAETPFAGAVQKVEGDLFTDPLPEGHDAVLLANVVHLFAPERNRDLFRRIRERTPADARLLLVDFWTDSTHTQPAFAALMAGEFLLVTGEGDVYSEEEVRGWLNQSGWQFLERTPLAGPGSLLVAETA